MQLADLEYEVVPGGVAEPVIHWPAVIVIALFLCCDTPKEDDENDDRENSSLSNSIN